MSYAEAEAIRRAAEELVAHRSPHSKTAYPYKQLMAIADRVQEEAASVPPVVRAHAKVLGYSNVAISRQSHEDLWYTRDSRIASIGKYVSIEDIEQITFDNPDLSR